MKERRIYKEGDAVNDDLFEDGEDLSFAGGPERLPDLEDQVERSKARFAITEKQKPKNPIEMKYTQKI
jgi:hypothetical protein